nr:immunoglobulin light chain junction region [Macaca mulatta]MOW18774.1 immunoglobulin light chain junction region [Macaca mulatta]
DYYCHVWDSSGDRYIF